MWEYAARMNIDTDLTGQHLCLMASLFHGPQSVCCNTYTCESTQEYGNIVYFVVYVILLGEHEPHHYCQFIMRETCHAMFQKRGEP